AVALRPAWDRRPRLGADDGRSRILVLAAMLHRACLDPLEGRLAAGQRDDLALHPVDVVDLLDVAPALDRIRVEADNVGAREELVVDLASSVGRRRALREVVGHRQERHAPLALRAGKVRRYANGHVRFVREVPADEARSGDAGGLRVYGRHRLAREAVELLGGIRAVDADEEVDPGIERRRVVRRALAP